ncbi:MULTISPECIES: membrane fusogenic activity family protein [unclassified Nocardiopsis]|uniref:membrane fusogenic activity family protein n=1 Tax=unclassified Nocardiopsis TaxID=2649073 RepID=UPI0033FFFCE3
MVVDAVRTYLDAANGLTELSRKQAVAAAKTLLRANGATPAPSVPDGEAPPRVGQSIQALASELIETSQANRAAVAELVRAEVRGALEQMDMVPRAEHERVVRRVAELERRMAARHAVERVLEPRGGASSELPDGGKAPSGRVRAPEAETRAAEVADVADGAAPVVEPERAAAPVEGETSETGREDPASAKGDPSSEETAPVADGAAGGAGDADPAEGARADTPAGSGAGRAKAKAPARATRPRSTAKRTTKGKGAKK